MAVKNLESWIHRRLVGYPFDLVCVLVATVFGGRSVLIVGKHGLGKNTVCRCLVEALGLGNNWGRYDGPTADIVSLAGIPDVQAMARGQLRFATHDRAIWKKELVWIDELTRANKETQNCLLEIVDEKTLFGMPLAYRVLLATSNPDAYAATYQLDEALLDRFAVVLILPDFQTVTTAQVQDIVRVNLKVTRPPHFEPPPPMDVEALRRSVKAARDNLLQDAGLMRVVAAWCSTLVPLLLDPKSERYISPRTFGHHLPHVLLDIMAFEAATGHELGPRELGRQCEWAARYALETKCHLDAAAFKRALRAAQPVLTAWQPSHAVADPLVVVTTGALPDRVAAVAALGRTALSPADRQRLDPLVRNLFREVLESMPDHPELPEKLWQACEVVPAVRRDMEVALLGQKLQFLSGLTDKKPRQMPRTRVNLVSRGKHLAAEAGNWSPFGPNWS